MIRPRNISKSALFAQTVLAKPCLAAFALMALGYSANAAAQTADVAAESGAPAESDTDDEIVVTR